MAHWARRTKMTKREIVAKIAEIQNQLTIDADQQLPGLQKAIEKAWMSGNAALAEELGLSEEKLVRTIAGEVGELKLLQNAGDGPFDLRTARAVRILAKVNQAVVTLPGPGGTTVERHVHLKGNRDKFGNTYFVPEAA